MDAEGNKIELWEPINNVFTAMDEKTTKENEKKADCIIAYITYGGESDKFKLCAFK